MQTGPVGDAYYGAGSNNGGNNTPKTPGQREYINVITSGTLPTQVPKKLVEQSMSFAVQSIRISNYTSYWLYIPTADAYVGPMVQDAIVSYPYSTSSILITTVGNKPEGVTQNINIAPLNGLINIVAYEDSYLDFAGYSILLSNSTAGAGVSPSIPALPVISETQVFNRVTNTWFPALDANSFANPNNEGFELQGETGVFPFYYDDAFGGFFKIRGDGGGVWTNPRPAVLAVKTAGGANAAATLTLPSPGISAAIYITYLRISRVSTAALAGANILTVTTTGLTGAPAYRTGDAMAAGDIKDLINMAFAHAIEASGPNTAVTFVAPAPGLGVSWDMEAHYFTAGT
jgi:hypothetical protein